MTKYRRKCHGASWKSMRGANALKWVPLHSRLKCLSIREPELKCSQQMVQLLWFFIQKSIKQLELLCPQKQRSGCQKLHKIRKKIKENQTTADSSICGTCITALTPPPKTAARITSLEGGGLSLKTTRWDVCLLKSRLGLLAVPPV